MVRKSEYVCVFLIGGIIYNLVELLWRGYTHPSMTLAGGVCMLFIHFLNGLINKRSGLVGSLKYMVKLTSSCLFITAVELLVGIVVNLILKLEVWDYSALPGNFLGQICPYFSILWLLISIPAYALSDASRKFFSFLEEREREDGENIGENLI